MKYLTAISLALSLAIFSALADEVQTKPTVSKEFLTILKAEFKHWDLNHDAVLESNELDSAMSDATVKGKQAAALAAIKRMYRKPKNPIPPLTLEALENMVEKRDPDLQKLFVESEKRINAASDRTLFADGMPKLENIHQGKLGNCFCLAPLGAMVHRDPKQVKAMFTNEQDGFYGVNIGGTLVKVAQPTDTEIALGASTEHEGIWVNLYEKAVGQLRVDKLPADKQGISALDAVSKGGSAGTMLATLTAHPMVRFSFKFAKDPKFDQAEYAKKLVDLRNQLKIATAENRLMTCGTIKPTTPDLTPDHAYAVLRFVENEDAVELWNPHGQEFMPKGEPGSANGYSTHNGVFHIKVEEFVKQFSGMAFEITESSPKS